MNKIWHWMFVSMMMTVMMVVAAPAFSSQATQIFSCEQDDDTTEDQLEAQAQEWLTAARTMKGGEGINAHLFFPVAVNSMRESDFFFVITTPSFAEWGTFWDGYEGSPAAAVDGKNNNTGTVCPNSGVWESVKIEPKK